MGTTLRAWRRGARWVHTVQMGFFDRNRDALAARGYDPARLPKGQYLTERFPVLHVGDVPTYGPGAVSYTHLTLPTSDLV